MNWILNFEFWVDLNSNFQFEFSDEFRSDLGLEKFLIFSSIIWHDLQRFWTESRSWLGFLLSFSCVISRVNIMSTIYLGSIINYNYNSLNRDQEKEYSAKMTRSYFAQYSEYHETMIDTRDSISYRLFQGWNNMGKIW